MVRSTVQKSFCEYCQRGGHPTAKCGKMARARANTGVRQTFAANRNYLCSNNQGWAGQYQQGNAYQQVQPGIIQQRQGQQMQGVNNQHGQQFRNTQAQQTANGSNVSNPGAYNNNMAPPATYETTRSNSNRERTD